MLAAFNIHKQHSLNWAHKENSIARIKIEMHATRTQTKIKISILVIHVHTPQEKRNSIRSARALNLLIPPDDEHMEYASLNSSHLRVRPLYTLFLSPYQIKYVKIKSFVDMRYRFSRIFVSFQFNQDLYSSSSGVPLTSSSASASSHSPCSPILPPSIAINAAQTATTTIPTIALGSGGGGGGGSGIGSGSGNISAVHHQHRSITKEEDNSVNRHSDNEGIHFIVYEKHSLFFFYLLIIYSLKCTRTFM